jgi:hypothetical protein
LNVEIPVHESTAVGSFIAEQQPGIILTIILRGLLEGVLAGKVVLRPQQFDRVFKQIETLRQQGLVDEYVEGLLKSLRH